MISSKIDTQLKHNDCGVSVIKTICNIYNVDIARSYIEDNIFLDAEGSRLSDIKRFLDDTVFDSSYRLLDLNIASVDLSVVDEYLPFILPTNSKNGVHFILIESRKKNKLKILDPSEKNPYYLSASEIRNIAYYNSNYVDLVKAKETYSVLCNHVLSEYDLDIIQVNEEIPFDDLFNKITYFLYIKDEYGLKDYDSEKKSLLDILYNQELTKLPKNFRILQIDREKVKIKTPTILSVKLKTKKPKPKIVEPESKKEENIYKSLFKQLGKNKQLWYLYIAVTVVSATITQLSVFINQILIDKILGPKNLSILLLFAIGVVSFKLFDLSTSLYKSWIGVKVGRALDQFFLETFDNKLNRFSLSYIQGYKRGDLTERLSDSMKLKAFFVRFFIRIMVDTVVSIYTLGILLYINWQLTLIVLVVMILFYVWFRVITPYLQQNERIRFIKKADFFSRMLEKLEGIQVLKSTHIEESYSNRVRKSISELLDIHVRTYKFSLLNASVSSIISIVASVAIIVFLSRESILTGLITIGQVITFMTLSQRVFSSLGSILDENLTLQENQVILKRFLDFEEAPKPQVVNGIDRFKLETIGMQKVAFGYHPEELVLKDISIDIQVGDKIKIEGRNGSGKSTLSKILSLLYEPISGQIMVNGINSKSYDQKKLGEKVLLVSNEDILFNDTFRYNIAFGEDISTSKITALTKELHLYDFIKSKDQGLDFMISENGKNLSTGQRKKILLLRALLHRAELVILDEVLAGIDIQSREEIENCLNKITDKTFIVISHEPIQLLHFNKIFLIADGILMKSN